MPREGSPGYKADALGASTITASSPVAAQYTAAVRRDSRVMTPVNVLRVLEERRGAQAYGASRSSDTEVSADAYSSVVTDSTTGAVTYDDSSEVPSVPASPVKAASVHDSVDSDKLIQAPVAAQNAPAVVCTEAVVTKPLAVAREAALEDDKVAITQTAPRMRAPERDVHATFLVAGDNGAGKTTFLQQLMRSYKDGASEVKVATQDGSSTSMAQFMAEPDRLATRLGSIKVPEERLNIHLNLQDSPGVGDDINYRAFLRMIVTYILKQQETDYNLLSGNIQHLGPAMAGSLKHSVTALLYFLPPHKLKKLDIIMMAALSQLVPVIPVVGKADTMTIDEASKYRDELVQALADADSFVARNDSTMRRMELNLFQFPDADLQSVGVEPCPEKHVYFVITSDTYQDGRPVRVYPYGVYDAANRQHSDFIVLKRLLMSDKNNGFWSLQDAALNSYYAFCEHYEASGMDLEALANNICAIWNPFLDYNEYLNMQKALKEMEQHKSKFKFVLAGLGKSVKKGSSGGGACDGSGQHEDVMSQFKKVRVK